jgi:hypothetical protein
MPFVTLGTQFQLDVATWMKRQLQLIRKLRESIQQLATSHIPDKHLILNWPTNEAQRSLSSRTPTSLLPGCTVTCSGVEVGEL